ncbi:MAG TPA: putative beta-lysine N-acetyltransferase [bacterium]|nr:putative beta-lysine N-acetyltransferase [bacterium]
MTDSEQKSSVANPLPRDVVETFHGAEIQHGPYNRRIYLMNIRDAHPERLIEAMKALCRREGYTKIFAKVPLEFKRIFTGAGFKTEAEVPKFYNGYQTAVFLGYYLDPQRKKTDTGELNRILQLAREKAPKEDSPSNRDTGVLRRKPLPEDAVLRECVPADTEQMAAIYRAVFPTYPFPIHSPQYLEETMHSHIRYFGIEREGMLVALSSAEMDAVSQNVEMTDFATLPAQRGHGFAVHLLKRMEAAMISDDFRLAYTIARARSAGMNITFSRLGYCYGGRLINNTQISGRIESMNVWYREL